jgi:two-component system, OmpR family, sensor histidine kinase BaeS
MVLLSRVEEHTLQFEFEVGSVGDVVAEAVGSMELRYRGKGVSLHFDREPTRDAVIDPTRLGQVVANLLTNALTATNQGGSVTVSVTKHGAERIEVVVRDTGIGIAPEQLPHVFERFYRVDQARDRNHGGFGIGLAIARAIVEGHRGRISAASGGLGAGATFTIDLPTAD